jgi:hypothetical protein
MCCDVDSRFVAYLTASLKLHMRKVYQRIEVFESRSEFGGL